jgi:hypothetical protein
MSMTQVEEELCPLKRVTMHRADVIRSILTVSPALNDRMGEMLYFEMSGYL